MKTFLCEKHLFGESILACEDEILNTVETSLVEKKITLEKTSCLIHTISLINICLLLLVVISICC